MLKPTPDNNQFLATWVEKTLEAINSGNKEGLNLRSGGAGGAEAPPDNFILAWTAVKIVDQVGGINTPITLQDISTLNSSNSVTITGPNGFTVPVFNPTTGPGLPNSTGSDNSTSTGSDVSSTYGPTGGYTYGSGTVGGNSGSLYQPSLRGSAKGVQEPPEDNFSLKRKQPQEEDPDDEELSATMTAVISRSDLFGSAPENLGKTDPYTKLLAKIVDQNIPAEGVQVKATVAEFLLLKGGVSNMAEKVDLNGKIL